VKQIVNLLYAKKINGIEENVLDVICCSLVGQGNFNILQHLVYSDRRSGASTKLFLNLLIQFYLNNVTNLRP